MRVNFGTDGVRGVANAELTPELVLALGRSAARRLPAEAFLLARDTRISGPLLAAALAAGLASEGTGVVDLGVLPTPGLAWVAQERQLPAAMISASHNAFADNGIKLFAPGGTKLPDPVEAGIVEELAGVIEGSGRSRPPVVAEKVGPIHADAGAAAAYADHLVSCLEGRSLAGVKVVLDCACGAASALAPGLLRRLGAEVDVIAADPDGTNINAGCGSTHPEGLQAAVLDSGAHVGLAFDGDADRVIAVDHLGRLVDGDRMLCLFALDMRARGKLAGDAVVVTIMTNLGFHRAMEAAGIAVHQTRVGDRYVLEELEAHGLALGGEQSGHIVFREVATTGDGILSGLMLMDLMVRKGRPLAEQAEQAMQQLPQALVNVKVEDPGRLEGAVAVWEELRVLESELAGTGRVLLRPSGTESCVRVMVEAPDPDTVRRVAARLSSVVERELGTLGAP